MGVKCEMTRRWQLAHRNSIRGGYLNGNNLSHDCKRPKAERTLKMHIIDGSCGQCDDIWCSAIFQHPRLWTYLKYFNWTVFKRKANGIDCCMI